MWTCKEPQVPSVEWLSNGESSTSWWCSRWVSKLHITRWILWILWWSHWWMCFMGWGVRLDDAANPKRKRYVTFATLKSLMLTWYMLILKFEWSFPIQLGVNISQLPQSTINALRTNNLNHACNFHRMLSTWLVRVWITILNRGCYHFQHKFCSSYEYVFHYQSESLFLMIM